ncbi:MAG: ATP synthase F0 subunit B [Proteobacteria bacterium]|nr:ATP synthase F0 subunit B [Pseudomonadota bacterium]
MSGAIRFGTLLFGLLWAGTALAAEEGGGGGLELLAFQALNLAILVFVITRFAGPAVRDYLRTRSRDIRERIDASQRALEQAQAEIAELRARLARSDEESRELVEQTARAAESEKQRSVARAEETAERIRGEARRVADREIDRARGVLQAEASQLAVELAEQILRERLTGDDDQRLVEEFAQRIGEAR